MGCVYSMQKDNLSQPLWKVILQRLRALSIREPHLVYHRSPSIKFACAYLLQSGSAHAYHEHVCWLVSYMFTTHYVESVQIRSYFWSKFSCIRTEYGDLLTELFLVRIFLYSIQIQGNSGQKWLRIWTHFMQWLHMWMKFTPLLWEFSQVGDLTIKVDITDPIYWRISLWGVPITIFRSGSLTLYSRCIRMGAGRVVGARTKGTLTLLLFKMNNAARKPNSFPNLSMLLINHLVYIWSGFLTLKSLRTRIIIFEAQTWKKLKTLKLGQNVAGSL